MPIEGSREGRAGQVEIRGPESKHRKGREGEEMRVDYIGGVELSGRVFLEDSACKITNVWQKRKHTNIIHS